MTLRKFTIYAIVATIFIVLVCIFAPKANSQPGSWGYATMNAQRWNDDVAVPNDFLFGQQSTLLTEGLEIVSYAETSSGIQMVLGIDESLLPGGVVDNFKVKNSIDDTIAEYLEDQITPGARGLTIVTSGGPGDETITISNTAIYTDISANDGDTGITGLELEELSDGSSTTLHVHTSARDTNTQTYPGEMNIQDAVTQLAPQYMFIDGIQITVTQAFQPTRSGSITGIAVNAALITEIPATTDQVRFEVFNSGVATGLFIDLDGGILLASNTQAVGVDTFAADDMLAIGAYYHIVADDSATLLVLNAIGFIEVYYD